MKIAVQTAIAACCFAAVASAAVPRTLGYEGRLYKADGSTVSGVTSMRFAIYAGAEGTEKLWQEDQRLLLTDGYYATYLGDVTPLPDSAFDGDDRYIEVSVGNEALLPRQKIAAVAFAIRADIATSVSGGSVDATGIAVNGTPVIDSTGRLTGNAAYVAGQGISIDTAKRTIGLSAACKTGDLLKKSGDTWVCASDAGETYSAGGGLELKDGAFSLTNACAQGQILKWNGQIWVCAADENARYAAGNGIAVTGNTISLTKGCGSSEVLKWDGTAWICAADDGANYRAGTGLAISANTISLTKACLPGEIQKFDGTNWTCAPDDNTKYTAGTGIQMSGTLVSLPTNCNANQILKWDGVKWACQADQNTAYAAGPGLALDGNELGIREDCGAGQSLRWNGTTWACQAPLTAGSGIEIAGNAVGLPSSCSAGQVMKWNGTAWACAIDVASDVQSGGGLSLTADNKFSILRTCADGEILRWVNGAWACSSAVAGIATNGGLGLTNGLAALRTCDPGQTLRRGASGTWDCADANVQGVATAGGLTLASGLAGLKSCTAGSILKAGSNGAWDCAVDSTLAVANAASDTSLTIVTPTSGPTTLKTNTQVVQTRVVGKCALGDSIQEIKEDGSVICASQSTRVIRWAMWHTYNQANGWIAGNDSSLFGGIAPSNWTDNDYYAYQMSPNVNIMRTLFNKKMTVDYNAMVWSNTYYPYSSTDGEVAAALIRIKNTTSSAITWTPCWYFTAYSGWNERASITINGANTNNWATGYGNSNVCQAVSVPAGRTSTVIIVSTSSPPSTTRSCVLAFYNNTFSMPTGLSLVEDLDLLPDGTNIWNQ